MGKLTDENGVKWDIRTTSVTVGPDPAKNSYFAAIDDSSERDYSGNQFPLDDDDTFPTGTKITWPAGGNPILRGAGSDDAAITAVRAFAARQKQAGLRNIALRVTATRPAESSGLVIIVALIALLLLADNKR